MPIPAGASPRIVTWQPYLGDWLGSINGLNFGAGTVYELAGLTGWRQIIAGPTGQQGQLLPPRQTSHGSFKQPYYVPFRIVNLQLAIYGTSVPQFEAALEALEAATVPNGMVEIPMSVQINGLSTTLNGVIETREILTDLESAFGLAHATIGIKASDPRRFAASVSATTTLPNPSSGMTFPAAFPAAFTGTASGGSMTLTSTGDATGPITAVVNGPLSGAFTLTHLQSGLSIGFNSAVQINAGDYLYIDIENRAVLYNGLAQASRNSWISQRGWFGLLPGANTVLFNAGSYSSTASITLTGKPAWL